MVASPEEQYTESVIKNLPENIKRLVLIGNYIEQIEGESPVSALKYTIYYNTIFGSAFVLESVLEILLSRREIWYPSKKKGYFYLKKEYKLPEHVIRKYLKVRGDEMLVYYKTLWKSFSEDTLAVLLFLLNNRDKYKVKNEEIRRAVDRLKALDIIKIRRGQIVLTKKGYKLILSLKEVLDLLGEKHIMYEFKI